MSAAPHGVRVYLACGTTDMRRGMAGLAMQVQQVLAQNPLICVGKKYVAARPRAGRFGHTARLRRHIIQRLSSSASTGSLGWDRAGCLPETPAFSSPRRIISTSAAA